MAEAVLKHEISQRLSLEKQYTISVDSAGTGAYHEGDEADDRYTAVPCLLSSPPPLLFLALMPEPAAQDPHRVYRPSGVEGRLHALRLLPRDGFVKVSNEPWMAGFAHRSPSTSLQTLENRRPPSATAKIALFGSFEPSTPPRSQIISDPYYGGQGGFETCYQQCVKFSRGFLDHLESLA
ncbi:hypothetical protein P7C73_g3772, partial [Tremellales sp. Uapishka_1]